jgi:hypothetical protein
VAEVEELAVRADPGGRAVAAAAAAQAVVVAAAADIMGDGAVGITAVTVALGDLAEREAPEVRVA